MAASYCLAILAGFCFHGANVSAHISDIGLGYAVSVSTPDYQAQTAQNDVIRFYDWRNNPKTCADASCVRYQRTCLNGSGKTACRYDIAIVGEAGGGYIEITATNAADVATAEAEISLWFGSDVAMLPLSALSASPQGAPLRLCPSDLDPKLCNPP